MRRVRGKILGTSVELVDAKRFAISDGKELLSTGLSSYFFGTPWYENETIPLRSSLILLENIHQFALMDWTNKLRNVGLESGFVGRLTDVRRTVPYDDPRCTVSHRSSSQ